MPGDDGKSRGLWPDLWRSGLCVVLAVLTELFVIAMVAARYLEWRPGVYPSLVLGSTCYVALGLTAGGLGSWYGRWILIGLAFCWVGDVVGPGNFALGAQAFLVAHLGFMAGFICRGLTGRRSVIAAVIWLPISGGLFGWLWPHVPAGERPLIFGYMAVITAMMILAGSTRGGPGWRRIVTGAAAFYVSDVLLARSRFIEPSFVNTAVGYPLYYAACVLLALSILRQPRPHRLERQGSTASVACGDPNGIE